MKKFKVLIIWAVLIMFSLTFFSKKTFAQYSPGQIKAAYGLPATGGTGTIAIIDAGSYSTVDSDLDAFTSQYGLPACNEQNGCLTVHYMGGSPTATSVQGITESALDVQWAHAIAPDAKILLVMATSMDTAPLMDAITYAGSQPGVVAVSMSFGAPGSDGTIPCDVFSNPNVAYFAATGDNGTSIDWPAVCPQVIAVGGTTLIMNGNTLGSEIAWSGSGGGLSRYVLEPSYQTSFNLPNANGHRGEPDVSAIADPHYGVPVFVQGSARLIGGTSLACPVWAGIASLNGSLVTHEILYGNAQSSTSGQYYRDITQGANGSCGTYCSAGQGYDYVTGLGSPIALPSSGGGNTNPLPGPGTSTTTTLPAGVPPVPVNPPSSDIPYIKGQAFVDLNGNRALDSNEVGLPGVSITLTGASSLATVTDSSGNYYFPKVDLGVYNFEAKINNFVGRTQTPAIQSNTMMTINIPVPPENAYTPTPTFTPTPTPNQGSGGFGSGGSGGTFDTPTPTPTPYITAKCVMDPKCGSSKNTVQVCTLICTPDK